MFEQKLKKVRQKNRFLMKINYFWRYEEKS